MSQFRPQKFSILPPVVKNLLIINGIMFLLSVTAFSTDFGLHLDEHLSLSNWRNSHFRPWQLFTYMFMHGDFGHLLFNMFGLWMFGYTMENIWGSKRFLNFYLITGVGSALFILIIQEFQLIPLLDTVTPEVLDQIGSLPFKKNYANHPLWTPIGKIINVPTVGASGAVYAILMAYALSFPNNIVHLYFMIPIKVKWLITGLIVYSIYKESVGGDNISHLGHLGGMLVAFILIKYWKKNNYLY